MKLSKENIRYQTKPLDLLLLFPTIIHSVKRKILFFHFPLQMTALSLNNVVMYSSILEAEFVSKH